VTSGRLRVLRIIDRLNVGGPALQTVVLTEGLDPARYEQRIVTGTVDAEEGDYVALRAPELPVERIQGLGRSPQPWKDAQAWTHLVRTMHHFRPHIVHTHKAKAGVLGRSAAWTARVPVTIHSFHGHLLHGYFSPRATKGVVAVERAFARRTTKLVAVGAQVRDDLLAAGVGRAEQYVVVPPGVPIRIARDKVQARRELDLPLEGPVVGFVGRLTRVKQPERFVDVALEVSRAHPDAVFVVAGDGELLHKLRDRARPLGQRMVFLGWRQDVETVYAACDLLVLTSDNEGMPVAVIEAASVGTPTVTTRVGSAPEVVIDGVTGFVTSTDVAALARATSRLLDDADLCDRMGSAAAGVARDRFSADRLVSDIAELYECTASEHGVI
jgi:glycosyltransferase involved in cell wall biosynthesis